METIIKNIKENILKKKNSKTSSKIGRISFEYWERIEGNNRLITAKNRNTNSYANNTNLYLDQSNMYLSGKVK